MSQAAREAKTLKILIKLGGTLLESAVIRQSLCSQIAALHHDGHAAAVVHGGGKRLSRYLQEQGFESEFRHGFRVTPPEILDAVLRIFAGSINHNLVAEMQRAGLQAVGLSGVDSGLVRATQLSADLGAVGRVEQVRADLLELLCANRYVPIVACIAGGADGAIYNVNADQMASACAAGFEADRLVYLTDIKGVLDSSGSLIRSLSCADAEQLIDSGVARGGMEAKLRAAMEAVAGGAGGVHIAAGASPDVLRRLLQGEDVGTLLKSG